MVEWTLDSFDFADDFSLWPPYNIVIDFEAIADSDADHTYDNWSWVEVCENIAFGPDTENDDGTTTPVLMAAPTPTCVADGTELTIMIVDENDGLVPIDESWST